jgi:hypothetical protein
LLWIGALLAAAAALVVFWWQSRVLPIHAVEVRPLVSESGPSWLAGAITEEIVGALRPAVQPSAEASFTAVLEGSVARSGDRVRVTARLSRLDGHRYWTRTFDRPITEISAELAAAIVPASRRKPARHKLSAKAYELFLEARQRFASNVEQAIAGFDRATETDPEFGRAWAWLSMATESLVEQGGGRPNELLPGARDAAERAVTLNPELADTHLALGIVRLQYDWDWQAAQRELDRALEIDPASPLAIEWRQRWLEAMDRAPVPPLSLAAAPRDPEAARRYLADAEDLRSHAYVPPAAFVLAANLAHDSESLFHWLDVAYEERSVHLPYLLRSPALPQADPRLQDLIRRLRLPTKP